MIAYIERDKNITTEGEQFLRGTVWAPDAESGPYPTLIVCHGLGGTHHAGRQFAERLCPAGFAVYSFDCRGGSPYSESSGSTLDMSIRTEAEDLNTVLSHVRTWDFADPDRVILVGESLGGIVCALTAAERASDVAALVLLYPALSVPDLVRQLFPSREDIPDTYSVLDWFPAGRPFAEDVYNCDPYEEIGAYKGPVLLLHGDQDHLIPVACSKKAAEAYVDALLYIVEGAGHGLEEAHFETYMQYIEPFLETVR